MLMMPLVHVHPEVEHSHGNPGHVHHAVTHTVFSAPLECEYPSEVDDSCPSGAHQHVQFNGHYGHSLAHPEIAFALATSSATPTISKTFLSPSTSIEDLQPPAPITIVETPSRRDVAPALLFLATALPLRAPPALLS
jgi:galactose mutarotase-like enzyme